MRLLAVLPVLVLALAAPVASIAGELDGLTFVEANYTWTKERLLWTTRREYWFKGAPASR